ncbi:unnamed protein product [Urochloa humidicola]
MAPDPIARPSPAARSSLSASAQPFYPADRHKDFRWNYYSPFPGEGSSSGQLEPSNRNVLLLPDSVQAVQSQKRKYTHFISLPLAIRSGHDDKLSNFQTSILRDEDKRLQCMFCGV